MTTGIGQDCPGQTLAGPMSGSLSLKAPVRGTLCSLHVLELGALPHQARCPPGLPPLLSPGKQHGLLGSADGEWA